MSEYGDYLRLVADQEDERRERVRAYNLRYLASELERLELENTALQKLRGTDDHPEHKCERCGGRNLISWYADSDVWNRVAVEYSVLCPICLGELADEVGEAPTAWRLSKAGDAPEVSKLQMQLHESLKERAELHMRLVQMEQANNALADEVERLLLENRRLMAVLHELREQRPRLEQIIEEYLPGLTETRLAEDLFDALMEYEHHEAASDEIGRDPS